MIFYKVYPMLVLCLVNFIHCKTKDAPTAAKTTDRYEDLGELFERWRDFESPELLNGAPDYTKENFLKRAPTFDQLRAELLAIDTTSWPVPYKVDWMIVWAEMNGYDFNQRILKPWERDPAYYQSIWTSRSDVPAHEGPTHHAVTELWQYSFPLSTSEKDRLINDISIITPLNDQAKINLTGNAKDLWIAGIRDISSQSKALERIKELAGVRTHADLIETIDQAIASTNDLSEWLTKESINKTGPSGIGKENYSWYLQNVHLVPLTWEDELTVLKSELASAWAHLKLEEHRNRALPEIVPVDSPESYSKRADESATDLMRFLKEEDIMTVRAYFDGALRAHLGAYVPEETRNFFWITAHLDPRPLYSHFYHWFELAILDNDPPTSKMRNTPLLYNIFDSRNEGMATAVEEWFMHAGLYDRTPRSREIVYIMMAQRAARGIGSLYAHANEMSMEEAGSVHSEYTPRGWMKTEKELLLFEQHLYLRQPGYGTSYISGKYLLKNTMAEFARQNELQGRTHSTKEFLDRMNEIGCIPVSLGHWELTGENVLKNIQ